ncbi:MAG: lactoylglutathione lyase [Gammaproteobacteria bacterium]|nr:lactoylglutathione lyase [Gammaproteobacteria bacterium]
MAKAIHTMIRVLDLDRSVQFYEQAFGLKPCHTLDFPDFTLVYLRNEEADFDLELTYNKGHTEPYTHGDGYGHIAMCVDDAAAEHARFIAAGLAPNSIVEFKPEGDLLARFFFVHDPDGYKIEVLERHGHYR